MGGLEFECLLVDYQYLLNALDQRRIASIMHHKGVSTRKQVVISYKHHRITSGQQHKLLVSGARQKTHTGVIIQKS